MHGTTMIFLVVVPDPGRLRQLPRAADDRRAGHGVPAPERALLLALPLRRHRALLSFFANGGAAARRLDELPAELSSTARATARTSGSSSLHILTVSSLAGAINFIVTIHNLRARGMSWTRMPLFVWAIEVYAGLLLVVLPTLSAGLTLLLLDRQAGTNFFVPTKAAAPCSTSMPSGSSATPRSTS